MSRGRDLDCAPITEQSRINLHIWLNRSAATSILILLFILGCELVNGSSSSSWMLVENGLFIYFLLFLRRQLKLQALFLFFSAFCLESETVNIFVL